MCWSFSPDWNLVYTMVRDWQTLWIAIPTIAVTWYMWEVSHLVQALETRDQSRSGIVARERMTAADDFDPQFAARRLAHLREPIAVRILVSALLKVYGSVAWTKTIEKFIEEHRSIRKSRAHLKKEKIIR